MRDSDVVAAIVAGDPDALTEAYGRYAAELYACCRLMLPAPDAADAVLDTFVIAVSRLGELRDPDRLGSWLYAVARHESLRRGATAPLPEPAAPEPAAPEPAAPDPGDKAPLPDGLMGQVLTACTDSTPSGRAYRAAVAYRAGAFTRTGFPKAPAPPRWWQSIRGHPRMAVAVAAMAALTAGVIPALALSGSPQPMAASPAQGGPAQGGVAAKPSAPYAAGPSFPSSADPVPSYRVPGTPARPAPRPATAPPATRQPAVQVQVQTQAPTPPSPTAAPQNPQNPQNSQNPPPPPAQGTLLVTPTDLVLIPAHGHMVKGIFVLTAVGGPVSFTVTVPPDLVQQVKITPSAASLPAGAQVTVTVTVNSKVPLDTAVTVNPGALTITIEFTGPA